MNEDELIELLQDIEAAGANQSGSLDWGTGGYDRAVRQGRDLRGQVVAEFAAIRAQLAAAAERERVYREAVIAVPMVMAAGGMFYCPWCKQPSNGTIEHDDDCLWIRALAQEPEVKP